MSYEIHEDGYAISKNTNVGQAKQDDTAIGKDTANVNGITWSRISREISKAWGSLISTISSIAQSILKTIGLKKEAQDTTLESHHPKVEKPSDEPAASIEAPFGKAEVLRGSPHREGTIKNDFAELEKIEKENPKQYSIATDTANLNKKNRYGNVFAHDGNIYRGNPEKGGPEYLNASLMKFNEKELDSTKYVATQAPLESTMADFMKAIVSGNTKTIVSLAMPEEDGRIKCHNYWENGAEIPGYGSLKCIQTEPLLEGNIVKRTLELTTENGETKRITHFQYVGWPDHGVPDPKILNALHDEVDKNRKPDDGPLFVHCSAGRGRTGIFIASNSLRNEISTDPKLQQGQVYNRVKTMREAREGMVQTEEQYEFIHKVLNDHLASKVSPIEEKEPSTPLSEISKHTAFVKNCDSKKASEILNSLPIGSALLRYSQTTPGPIISFKTADNRIQHGTLEDTGFKTVEEAIKPINLRLITDIENPNNFPKYTYQELNNRERFPLGSMIFRTGNTSNQKLLTYFSENGRVDYDITRTSPNAKSTNEIVDGFLQSLPPQWKAIAKFIRPPANI